jgi:hypothetical protein
MSRKTGFETKYSDGHRFAGRISHGDDTATSAQRTAMLDDTPPAPPAPGRVPKPGSYLSGKKALIGPTWEPMDPARADIHGLAADGFTVVESSGARARKYIRDTGRTLPANRTRPAVAVYDVYDVDTYVGEIDGRPTVLGRPSSDRTGEMFLLVERVL